ncbi:MAG: MBOAT family protein [Spirochaetes bacterium]|nr:MBOAT family protein [Spirochaetota bacterium]
MVFSSVHFLFIFLPVVLTIHFILGKRFRNLWLLLASLFFYAYGEKYYTIIMIVSISANYFLGVWIERNRGRLSQRTLVIIATLINLGLLGFFKYANFMVANVNAILEFFGACTIPNPRIHLPIGISFFTFQALSYVIDVYRKEVKAQEKLTDIALYITLFPQLIAGPIVRYHDVATQLTRRTISREKFALGIKRFIIGLGKKMLIANTLAITADRVFTLPANDLTTTLAWAGSICYSLQLYFDFSGYSDMAIGLGHMLGFTFLENFNYPYISLSIREHWKRWHISLTSWMRDYLYISLGGSRCSTARTYFNLMIIFVATAFWHGAEWHFLFWGLWNGLFMALERAGWIKPEKLRFKPLQLMYALLVILIGHAMFRADTAAIAFNHLAALFGFARGTGAGHHIFFYMQMETWIALVLGIIGCAPICPYLDELITTWINRQTGRISRAALAIYPSVKVLLLMGILGLSIIKLSASTYNPFIYFRF